MNVAELYKLKTEIRPGMWLTDGKRKLQTIAIGEHLYLVQNGQYFMEITGVDLSATYSDWRILPDDWQVLQHQKSVLFPHDEGCKCIDCCVRRKIEEKLKGVSIGTTGKCLRVGNKLRHFDGVYTILLHGDLLRNNPITVAGATLTEQQAKQLLGDDLSQWELIENE